MSSRSPILSWADLLAQVAKAARNGYPRRTKSKLSTGAVCSVYFIRGTTTGRIKIGESMNVPQRFRALQSAASETLELLLVIGNARDNTFHKKFRKYRLRGEWYEGSPALLKFIASRKRVRP